MICGEKREVPEPIVTASENTPVRPTEPTPEEWFEKGQAFEFGRGQKQNIGEAIRCYEKAAQVARCTHFINADLIAAGLSPLAPERELMAASRLFLREIEERIAARENFAFETTLAGRAYLRLIERLHGEGWRVELIYLALPSLEMSKLRVEERVAHGGHNIPTKDIERRFPRSLRNLLEEFSHRADSCICFMNDGESPVLIFEQRGNDRDVIHDDYHQLLMREAQR